MDLHDGARIIEREVATSICRTQLVSADRIGPIELVGKSQEHYLQLTLLPQAKCGEVCYPQHWGRQRFAPVGEVFFYPAGQLMHVRADCPRQEAVVCIFEPEAAARFLDGAFDWDDGRLAAGLNVANAAVRNLMLRVAQEMRRPGYASATLIEAVAAQMLIELARYFQGIEHPDAGGGLAPWRMKLIDERLRDGMTVPTLEELAALCKLSVRHLTRAFRASRGKSIGDYIAEQRMEQAKALLLSGVPVKVVSQRIGFTSSNNFSAAFRRMTGESPREFMVLRTRGCGTRRLSEMAGH